MAKRYTAKFQSKQTRNITGLVYVGYSEKQVLEDIELDLAQLAKRNVIKVLVSLEEIGNALSFTLAKDLYNRTGITPAYGDYEATGWMDENHFGS